MKRETVIIGLVVVIVVFYFIGGQEDDTDTTDSAGGGPVGGWSQVMAGMMATFENANPAYNNPLALQGTGDTGTTAPNGLGIFSSASAGLAAGIAKLEAWAVRFPSLTINQILARWQTGDQDADSPSIDNESNMVGDALGVDPYTTTMSSLGGSDDSD